MHYQRSSQVFGPMVHELFNEDSPSTAQRAIWLTAAALYDCMWRSQLRAIVTIPPLYGRYTIKTLENMQNNHIQKSQHHQTLLLNCFSCLWCSILKCWMGPILISRFMSRALQTATCFNTRMDCQEASLTLQ